MDVEGQGTCRTCHQPTLTIRPVGRVAVAHCPDCDTGHCPACREHPGSATDRYCRCGALLDVRNGTTALEGRRL